jgi:hypothetical protein
MDSITAMHGCLQVHFGLRRVPAKQTIWNIRSSSQRGFSAGKEDLMDMYLHANNMEALRMVMQ